jgi:cytochrome c-type biogenesis protein
MDVTLGLALLAGVISFISPCVLPLVPAYIGYLGGRMTNTVAAQVKMENGIAVMSSPSALMRFNTFLHGVAFVVGFTFIFVIIGILGTALIQYIGGQNLRVVTDIIGRLGGVIIIFFGLHFMGVLPSVFTWLRTARASSLNLLIVVLMTLFVVTLLLWGFTGYADVWNIDERFSPPWTVAVAGVAIIAFLTFLFLGRAFDTPGTFLTRLTNTLDSALYSDTRQQMVTNGNQGFAGSVFMGIVFAAGWTPCIGPVYGAILTMSANTGNINQALPLLTAYSLGLGIPFLLCALALDSAQGSLRRLQRQMRTIKLVSGALLVMIGVLVASGRLQELSSSLNQQFADVSVRTEKCVIGLSEGDIYFSQLGDCLNGAATFEDLKAQNLTQ